MAVNAADESGTRASPRKHETVARLTEKLGRATSAVVTDYRGLTVHQLELLRTQLRSQGVDYVIVKNTLARRAAEAAGIAHFGDVLVGPVGLAMGYGDLATPAKVLSEYFRVNRRLPSIAGLVEGTVLDADRGSRCSPSFPRGRPCCLSSPGRCCPRSPSWLGHSTRSPPHSRRRSRRTATSSPRPHSRAKKGIKNMATQTLTPEDFVEALKDWTVLDVVNAVKLMEEKLGVKAAAPVAAAAAPAGGAGAEAAPEEQTEFSVVLTAIGDAKINVIKAVREITQLGLKEAKDLVDGAPKAVREGVSREDADVAAAKLKEAGASVEIR